MALNATLTTLPAESIIHILLFLPPREIRRCLRISRHIMEIFQSSSLLQYLLELDSLGFSAPVHPRLDLTYDQKIESLKEMRTRFYLKSDIPSRVELGAADPQISNCQFSRGVFARGGPNIDVTRGLSLHKLPSFNKNTEYERWILSDLGFDANDYRIDSDADLLVLLQTDPSPDDPNIDLMHRFHIRSLSTGLQHPLSATPFFDLESKFTSTYAPAGFQIVGRYIAILCYTNALLDSSTPTITVWDWTTGEVLTFADVPGRYFAFVSDSTFIVQCDRRKWASADIIGSLEIYTFDPKGVSQRARHVASLHLPATTESPCHSNCSFAYTPPPISLSLGAPTTPARIHEFSSDAYYLCFRVRVHNIKSCPSEMAMGTLFIPAHAILNAMSRIDPAESLVHVPWEDWAEGTSWINTRSTHGERDHVFGQRAAFVRYDYRSSQWEIAVYDLGPSARLRVEDPRVSVVRRRAKADVYVDKVFLDGPNGAGGPELVRLITIPEDVVAGNTRSIDNPPQIVIDDEHILIFKPGSQTEGCSLHVYAL